MADDGGNTRDALTGRQAAGSSVELHVAHHFDAAHRLPQLVGKCASMHGHTWHVAASLAGPVGELGIVTDFSSVKGALRGWIDAELDHATLIGTDDPLRPALAEAGCRLKVFGAGRARDAGQWPTVEAVAALLSAVWADIVDTRAPGAWPLHLSVREGGMNSAVVRWR